METLLKEVNDMSSPPSKLYNEGYNLGFRQAVDAVLDRIKKRTEGLIKFHEDRIEEKIKDMRRNSYPFYDDTKVYLLMTLINDDYESIMAIEHWLESIV